MPVREIVHFVGTGEGVEPRKNEAFLRRIEFGLTFRISGS